MTTNKKKVTSWFSESREEMNENVLLKLMKFIERA